jgi:hypothetical protein
LADSFSVNVSFSHHCYSRGLPRKGGGFDTTLLFEVEGDERLFVWRQVLFPVNDNHNYR